MLSELKKLAFSQTGKDTSIVFVGTAINIVIGGLFFIIVPRILGPQSYGVLTIVIATGLLATNVANFGIDSGILKFAKKDSPDFNSYLTIAFKSYLISGAIIGAIGLITTSYIVEFLKIQEYESVLRVAFISIIFLLLTNFYVASLQAKKEFAKALYVNVISNLARLLLVVIGFQFYKLDLPAVAAIFFLVPMASIVLGHILLKFRFEDSDEKEFIKFHKFNFWLALAFMISSVPLDNYFLIKIAGPVATGIYAAPYKLLTAVHQLSGNFSRVLASRYSAFDSDQKVIIFSKKVAIYVFLFFLFSITAVFIAPFLIKTFLGNDYQSSISIFRILVVGFAFFFSSTIPLSIILYYFGKSQVTFNITLVRVILNGVLLSLLVQRYQAEGAAFAFLITELIVFVGTTFYCAKKLKKI